MGIYKKKAEIIYKTTNIKKNVNVVQSTHYNVLKTSNKENLANLNDYSMNYEHIKCPFDSPTSIDFNFDTSEVFSNIRKTKTDNILSNTYDKSYNSVNQLYLSAPQNVLKPNNKQINNDSATDLFDNLTFTPLKALSDKSEKLDKGPKIIISVNSESDLDDSLDMKATNKENEKHSIICISSFQQNTYSPLNHQTQVDNQYLGTPVLQHKKIPNTSSPKELNSPNFSINTDFSRISELSFAPPRFSTERKIFPKVNIEPPEIFDDLNFKANSDTYTKDSPNTPMEIEQMRFENRPPHYFMKDQPKICKQSLFRESHYKELYDKVNLHPFDNITWPSNLRSDIKSPPRSVTPPLQSIPEESTQYSDTQVLDKTDKQMATFTINRTFDKLPDRPSLSTDRRQTWSKKDVRAEPELWKVPTSVPRKSLRPRVSINSKDTLGGKMSVTLEGNKSMNQNVSLNQVGNIYSQSTTVDPFLSATYFYDEEAVQKLEQEFMRWLNCVLTPPADLDSNVEQNVDVGKAWLDNRSKEVPAAPTREQVSNAYHNSHRLDSLRKAARALLLSPEIVLVFKKLTAQIEKKLIAVRTDKNIHLDVGLQKSILELLLCYNPLWLRIGLEVIYGLVLPLKSNSDIEGLTTFIVKRMFKNPFLKSKNSKSSAPNMLLPAYMEAIKKFTLKKFFMLVFFLDQAKQRKLISHDPCLFCRNAICKESREIIIRFTRELISGIGDITKHLRPLGYVVSHKQSYLDEYKYAVHNIALDIRDGVRLTKVMEIILMKNGLLNQLRTPPISRLQKIHNIQVAMTALKESNFVINGDISAQDIADGHREKTLSLLWQLIHVFRAPLFVKAASLIQTWWRKKYEVIVEKRKEEEKIKQKYNNAASVIQCWWRRIQYNRLVEWQMKQIVTATITIQKYCRMWINRTRFRKWKSSVLKIEEWFLSVKLKIEPKNQLQMLRRQREELKRKSATIIQSHIRRWLCIKQYKAKMQKIILLQSITRCVLVRKWYLQLRKSVTYVQRIYRAKLLMKAEMQTFSKKRYSAVVLQSYFKMIKQRKLFIKLKESVKVIEEHYKALIKMRQQQKIYTELKKHTVTLQSRYRGRQCQREFLRQKQLIIKLQQRVKAYLQMKKEKQNFLKLKHAAVNIQRRTRLYLKMKRFREAYIKQRNSAILIQRHFRAYRMGIAQRNKYLQIRFAAIVIQTRYRNWMLMRQERLAFLKLKNAALVLQRRYRARNMKKLTLESYHKLRSATLTLQRRFRAQMKMRDEKTRYLQLKSASIVIQKVYRAYLLGKQERQRFMKIKEAVTIIQNWFRSCKIAKQFKQEYHQSKQACVIIQRVYRAYIIGRKQRQEYIKIRTATVCIQTYYRTYVEMRMVRNQFIQLKTATVTIQRHFRSYLVTKKQYEEYQKIRSAAQTIQKFYRLTRQMKEIRQKYYELKKNAIVVQQRYRSLLAMRAQRAEYQTLRKSVITIQRRFRALLAMQRQRQTYAKLRAAVITIQTRYIAQCLMRKERQKYILISKASTTIQTFYRAYVAGKNQRENYQTMKMYVIKLQHRYRALLAMRKERKSFLTLCKAAICVQRRFRAHKLMVKERFKYQKILNATITIQRGYRAYKEGETQRAKFMRIRSAVVFIQTWFRSFEETKRILNEYRQFRKAVLFTQRRFRAIKLAREIRRENAVKKIQSWYRAIQKRNYCRRKFLELKKSAVTVQSTFRMLLQRKRFLSTKNAALTIQTHYRSYKLSKTQRAKYVHLRLATIKLQSFVRSYVERKRFVAIRSAVITIQTAFRSKKARQLTKQRRETAAICIQKNYKRYVTQSRYLKYREQVSYIQRVWRSKLVTRLIRCEFLQKRRIIIQLQAAIRGYLVRRFIQCKRHEIEKVREEQKRLHAAAVIQVCCVFIKGKIDMIKFFP